MSSYGGELDARYRRVLMLLPRAYRAERGEEMLGVMLDVAEEHGRKRPAFGEVVSVLGLSLRLRTGAPGASARSRSVGEALRLIALLGLLLQAAVFVQNLAEGWDNAMIESVALDRMIGHTPGPAVIAVLSFVCPFLAMIALLSGRYRVGALLAANPVVLVTEASQLFTAADDYAIAVGFILALLTLCAIPAAAGLLGFHRGTPRINRPYRWLLAMVLIGATFAELDYGNDLPLDSAWWCVGENIVAVGCACIALALALSRARYGAVWTTALMVVGAPLLCDLPYTVASLSNSAGGTLLDMLTSPDSMYFYIGLYALVAEVLLALILAVTLLRQLRTSASGGARPAR
jgi:hypothetical protein